MHALAVLLTAAALAQDPTITGARLTIREEKQTALAVTLTNQRDVPLVAWELGVVRAGKVQPVNTTHSDYSSPGNWAPGTGPIRAGERRTIRVPVDDPEVTPVVVLAVFGDGHVDGLPSAMTDLHETRRRAAGKLRYWLDATAAAVSAADDNLRDVLQAVLKKAAGDPSVADSFAGNLVSAVTEPDRSAAALRRYVTWLRASAQARLSMLETSLVPAAGETASVGLQSTASTIVTLYARVENLRDVPLEALTVRWSDDRSRSGGLGTDMCCLQSETAGPIRRGEIRELMLRHDSTQARDFRLEFLLFADFTWEGDSRERDYMLRMRELRAADAAYWSPILAEASLMPAAQAMALLEARKKERAIATALIRHAPYSPFQRDVEEIVRRTKRNPADFARAVHDTIWRLELYRVQALRHVGGKSKE